jgi:hypothetical protein
MAEQFPSSPGEVLSDHGDLPPPAHRDAVRAVTVAMITYVGEASVPIMHAKQGPIGSGTLVSIGDRFFATTAAHVVRDMTLDEIEIPFTMRASNQRALLRGFGWRGGGNADPVDVAWIEIQPATARAMARKFLPLSCMRPGIAHHRDMAFVLGFPSDQMRGFPPESADDLVRLDGVGACTPMLGADELANRFRPDFDTYVAWPDLEHERVDEGWVRRSPAAYGVSGGSIWVLFQDDEPIWRPECARMVAIEQSWMRGEWLRGTQVQHWLRMVAEDIPELRDVIMQAFPVL